MSDTKSWYLSRTIWASLVGVVIAAGSLFGLTSSEVDQGLLTDGVVELISAVAGIVAIIGRLRATAKIG